MGLIGEFSLLLIEGIRSQRGLGVLIGDTEVIGGLTGFITVAIDTEAQLGIVEEATIDPYFTTGQALIITAAALELIKGRLLCRVDRCLALHPAVITPVRTLIPGLLDLIICGEFGAQCLTQGFRIIIGIFVGGYIEYLLGSRNHLIYNIRFRIRVSLLLNGVF